MREQGIKFVTHIGMEKDDTPSYATPELIDAQHPTLLRPEGDPVSHWEGEEVIGVSPVRGKYSSEVFNASILAAQEGALGETLRKQHGADSTVDSATATLTMLR